MLESRYFLRLLQFVGERTRDHTKANRDKITKDRRAHYKAAEWKEYEDCVKKGLDLEDQASQHVLTDILNLLQIGEEEFANTHRSLANNE